MGKFFYMEFTLKFLRSLLQISYIFFVGWAVERNFI